MLQNFFRKSRFPPKLEQQELAIFNAINSVGIKQFCLKIAALFSHFCACSDIRLYFFLFFYFGES